MKNKLVSKILIESEEDDLFQPKKLDNRVIQFFGSKEKYEDCKRRFNEVLSMLTDSKILLYSVSTEYIDIFELSEMNEFRKSDFRLQSVIQNLVLILEDRSLLE